VPFTSGFLAKFYVVAAAVDRGQYALAIIGMLAAAIAAFFYLRVALLMYSNPDGDQVTDGTATAGLAPPLLSAGERDTGGGTVATVVLQAPPDAKVEVPFTISVALVVCVAFTIFAGVAPQVLDFARNATQISF
jgi:NADH-quinone oxidoreductase subunit N